MKQSLKNELEVLFGFIKDFLIVSGIMFWIGVITIVIVTQN